MSDERVVTGAADRVGRGSQMGALLFTGVMLASALLPGASASAAAELDLPADLAAVLPATGTPGVSPGAELSAVAVDEVLQSRLGSGSRVSYQVIDVLSGEHLADGKGTRAAVPASTMKLVTAVAALTTIGPDIRLRTEARLAHPAAAVPTVVLVGGGDPSLTTRSRATTGEQGTASLQALAARTARALALRGTSRVRIGYDAGLFTGAAVAPAWSAGFVAQGVVAPVSALVTDQGKPVPTAEARAQDPAGLAASRFAERLRAAGVAVQGSPRELADPTAARLGWVDSPPLGELVEHMLTTSDNDYAEALARLAAIAGGEPGSFRGVQRHNRAVLRAILTDQAISLRAVRLRDGSGLSRTNRLSAAVLAGLLVAAANSWDDPAGGRLSPLLSGLPIAGVTGSLHNRFTTTAARRARGAVRAKTGTLTGIASLAGYAQREDGRLTAFAFLNDHATTPASARRALDNAAAQLVLCKCAD